MVYNSDDKYLYDLSVRVKNNDKLGQYQYMVKNEVAFYIEDVLTRSYYRHETCGKKGEDILITTNCEPDAFKMVYERALMDKYKKETGIFAITENEARDDALKDAITSVYGQKSWIVCGGNDNDEGKA